MSGIDPSPRTDAQDPTAVDPASTSGHHTSSGTPDRPVGLTRDARHPQGQIPSGATIGRAALDGNTCTSFYRADLREWWGHGD